MARIKCANTVFCVMCVCVTSCPSSYADMPIGKCLEICHAMVMPYSSFMGP